LELQCRTERTSYYLAEDENDSENIREDVYR
jgi:hypothetical protein